MQQAQCTTVLQWNRVSSRSTPSPIPTTRSNLRRRMHRREEKVQEDFADFEANQHLMREIPDPYCPGSFFVFNVQEGRWERETWV
ncbi:hypothetical protein AVEN_242117-1 [Araneus ventricosus]|uniref:Uncharacterized protein n=1 Tax=Araneus ventricosus TaxID=182803 RepID=A0A4Y2SGH2_ARAVE|nr:hypothetical protein AVEN_242117-1 [Araneus ventricosus]